MTEESLKKLLLQQHRRLSHFYPPAMGLHYLQHLSHMITAHSNTLVLNVIMKPNYNIGVGAVYCTLLNPSTSVTNPIFTPQKRASVWFSNTAIAARRSAKLRLHLHTTSNQSDKRTATDCWHQSKQLQIVQKKKTKPKKTL